MSEETKAALPGTKPATKPVTGKKPATKPATRVATRAVGGEDDGFDDDFEKLEVSFPPIFSFLEEGDSLVFIPRGTSEGPNGTLILCELVKNEGKGEFVLKDEAYDLNKGDAFSLGVKTVFIGDNKIVTADHKGILSQPSKYCQDHNRPIKLVYTGKQKSGSGFRYDTFDIFFTKDVMAEFFSK